MGFSFLDLLVGTVADPDEAATLPNPGSGQHADYHKYSTAISDEIRKESDLIASRMNWNLTFQGFLFASYALTFGGGTPQTAQLRLQDALPWAGLMVAAAALIGIVAAYHQINRHKRKWLAKAEEIRKVAPQPFSGPGGSLVGRLPPLMACGALIFVWGRLIGFW